MKKLCRLALALALGLSACGDSAHGASADDDEGQARVGTLSLSSLGTDRSGRRYRLRNASFAIVQTAPSSYPYATSANDAPMFSTTVSSDTDLEADVISLRVVPGTYYVSLANDDWYLERKPEGVWQRVDQAVLLSRRYQDAFVADQANVGASYRFAVDGQLIDFRSGELQIGLESEPPDDARADVGQDAGVFVPDTNPMPARSASGLH